MRSLINAVPRYRYLTMGRPGLVSEIYSRAERLVREAPDRYPFNYVAIAALMTRTGA
jgi:hypothetical protein